jgi:hypothetical protein
MLLLSERAYSGYHRCYLFVGHFSLECRHEFAFSILGRVGDLGIGARLLPFGIAEIGLALRAPVWGRGRPWRGRSYFAV